MTARGRLTRLRIWLVFAAVSLLAGMGLLLRSASDLAATEERLRTQALRDRVADELERELTRVYEREDQHPFLHFRTTWVPAGGNEAVLSPLSAPDRPAEVVGYFQIEPDGTWSTPGAADEPRLRRLTEGVGGFASGPAPAPRTIARTIEVPAPPRQAPPADNQGEMVQQAIDVERGLNRGAIPRQMQSTKNVQSAPSQIDNFLEPLPAAVPTQTRVVSMTVPPALDPNAVDVVVEPLRAVPSAADDLVLVRSVRIGWQTWVQGVVLDVTRLTEAASTAVLADPVLADAVHIDWSGEEYTFESPFDALSATVTLSAVDASSAAWRWVWGLAVGVAVVALLALVLAERGARSALRWAEQREQFTQAVTHELKTPVAALQLYSEMLEQGMVADDEARTRYHRTMRSEAARLGRLVDQVLLFSRLDRGASGHGPVAPVGQIVGDAVALLEPLMAERDCTVSLEVAPGLDDVLVPADAIAQVVHNLVENAAKFLRPDDDRQIDVKVNRDGALVSVAVRDRGPGVAEAHLETIFGAFERLEDEATRSTTGTGLGLALVKRLATSVGGTARAHNAPDGGLVVTVRVPRTG